jgi:hypothetical protein
MMTVSVRNSPKDQVIVEPLMLTFPGLDSQTAARL